MYTFKEDVLKISVRNLVEFICRGGDLDNRRGQGGDKSAMEAGSRAHRRIQKQMGAQYAAEVSLKYTKDCGQYRIALEGRADGIITEDDIITIDEIKGVYRDLRFLTEPVPVHKAQAMCYAYIYGMQQELNRVGIRMTYVNLDTDEIKYFTEICTLHQLEEWFNETMEKFIKWTDFLYESKKVRKQSIKGMEFPFEYRDGQKNLAVSVYKTINLKKTLFIQAPTGVGKTMSTVFPSIKAIGEDLGDKLFYLTAKTITRTVAEEAFDILRSKGLIFRTVTITAKEKICGNVECQCNPDACPYAKGHFDRVNDAVYDMVTHEDVITRETIEEYANKHTVCPFEFTLDATYWVDGVICDYNYVFDPNVYLKRYFSENSSGDYIFLIDEAHNLVDRAREMYSAPLYKDKFLEMKRLLGDMDKRLTNAINKCNKELLALKRECETVQVLESIGALELSLSRLYDELTRFLEDREKRDFEYGKELAEFFFDIRHFLNMRDNMDDNYVIYTEQTEDGFMLKLLCVNPSKNLRACLDKGNASIFFSATLLPITYYKELLSNKDDYAIYAHSPFDIKNRCLVIGRDVTSRYTRRNEAEFNKVKNYINSIIQVNAGNYMVFFPSYGYMNSVYGMYSEEERASLNIIAQSKGMNEQEREEFLARFTGGESACIGFCVIGGIFSEGIDLKNESLIGCIIVGTGLPQICTERQLLRDYYDKRESKGYDYAYVYPGMNKVMQAAGRVIRTAEDRGVIALLDERFYWSEYVNLFPVEWGDYLVADIRKIRDVVGEFWKKSKKIVDKGV